MMPQPAPIVVTKDWTPPSAPGPKDARRIALLGAHEELAAAHANLCRAMRLDDRDEDARALVALTAAFKSIATVREAMRVIVEDVG